jgi:hypothetical protein
MPSSVTCTGSSGVEKANLVRPNIETGILAPNPDIENRFLKSGQTGDGNRGTGVPFSAREDRTSTDTLCSSGTDSILIRIAGAGDLGQQAQQVSVCGG